MLRGNWSSTTMRARQLAALSSHRLSAETLSWSERKRILTSASNAASFSNQRLCDLPRSGPVPNQNSSTSAARWSVMGADVKLAPDFSAMELPMFRRLIASLLVACIALPLPAQAGMIATDAEREHVARVLERADVQARLVTLGVDPAAVRARVAALNDDEVAALAARIDTLPAGGADIIGALLLVFIVLLITDILGLTKVFPFTKPIR